MTRSDVNSPKLTLLQTSLVNLRTTQADTCRECYIRHNTNDHLNSPWWMNTCGKVGGASEVFKCPQQFPTEFRSLSPKHTDLLHVYVHFHTQYNSVTLLIVHNLLKSTPLHIIRPVE